MILPLEFVFCYDILERQQMGLMISKKRGICWKLEKTEESRKGEKVWFQYSSIQSLNKNDNSKYIHSKVAMNTY